MYSQKIHLLESETGLSETELAQINFSDESLFITLPAQAVSLVKSQSYTGLHSNEGKMLKGVAQTRNNSLQQTAIKLKKKS